MNKKLCLWVVLLCCYLPSHAQLIINEFSQGTSGNKEFLELVVTGTRTCNDSTADIRNWIIDDNGGWYGTSGVAQGCFRFKQHANWAAVPYGSIILLYNTNDKNTAITLPDDPTDANNDHVYVVPDTSSYLERNTANPNSGSGTAYSYPTTGFTQPLSGSWVGSMAWANAGDAVVIVSPSNLTQAYHSIAYGACSLGSPTIYKAVVGGISNCYLTDNQFTAASSYAIGVAGSPNETPGAANGGANTAWVTSLRTPAIITNNISAAICAGQSYIFNGIPRTTANTYTATFTSAAGCDSVVHLTLSVTPLPVITQQSFTNPSGCLINDGTISLGNFVVGSVYNVGYAFNSGSPLVVMLTADATGKLTLNNLAPGSYSNITITQNGCSSSPLSTIILTAPSTPLAPTINTNSPVCAGDTLKLNTTTVAGATYNWSGPSFTSTQQNPHIISSNLSNAGSYTLSVTIAGCTSAMTSTTVVVNPLPATPTASNNGPTCPGNSLNLSANNIPGATFTWTGPNSYSATGQTQTINPFMAVNAGTYSVRAQVGSCISAAGFTTAMVAPVPIISGSSFISPTSCGDTNGSITLDGLLANTSYSISYLRNGSPVSISIVSTASGSIILNNLNAASYSNITLSLGGCTSSGYGPFLLVDPSAPSTPVISSNSPVCAGSTLNLMTNTIPGATYSWTGPLLTSSSQSPSIANVNISASGLYSVTATVNGCTSTAGTVNVVINSQPIVVSMTSTNPTTCGGNDGSITLSGLLVNTTYAINYLRNAVPISVTITSNASGNISITGLDAALYSDITVSLNSCTSLSAGPVSLINPPGTATPVLSSNSPVCEGAVLSLSASSVPGGTFSWTGPNGFNSSSSNPTLSNVSTMAAGVYTLTVSVNGCNSAPVPILVDVVANPVSPVISSNSLVCFSSSLTLFASGTAGTIFNWSGPNGFTSSLQNPVLTNVSAAQAGIYSVTSTVATCTSLPATATVIVTSIAAPSVISPINYCQHATAIPLAAVGTNLKFYTSATGGIGVQTLTPSTSNTGSTTYYVSQSDGNCESVRTAIVVNISAKPSAPVVGSNIDACQFESLPTLTAIGQNLRWYTVSTGGSSSSIAPVPNTTSAGVYHYYVSQTVNDCESDRAIIILTVRAKPAPPGVVSPLKICQYQQQQLTATGISLKWYLTATGGTGQSLMVANTAYIDSIDYFVTQTINGCESDRARIKVVVNYKPNGLVLASQLHLCEGVTDTFNYFGNGVAPAFFNWSTGGGLSDEILSGQGSSGPVIMRFNVAGVRQVNVQVNNDGCLSDIVSQTITVRPNPKIAATIPESTCKDEVINVALNSITPSIDSFKFDFPGAEVIYGTQTGGPYGIVYRNAGRYTIDSRAYSKGCPSHLYSDTIFVHNLPDARLQSVSNAVPCAGDSLKLRALVPDDNSRYYWSPEHFFSTGNTTEAVAIIKAAGFVTLKVVSQYGCINIDSTFIDSRSCCNLYFPNAFSPNNDGRNDVFRPVTAGNHEIYTFRVFNRWGQVVYETKLNGSGWDGNYNGRAQDVGTYNYYIKYKCFDGNDPLEQKGEFILIH